MSKLIYFLGPEGAGKSTQIALLAELLKQKRRRTKVMNIRSNHLWAYFLTNLLIRLGYFEYWERPDGTFSKGITVRTVSSRLYNALLYLDVFAVLLLAFFKCFIPLLLGYTVLAERYLIDTLTEIIYQKKVFNLLRGDKQDLTEVHKWALLLKFIPKNSIIFVLDTDYSTLVERYKKRNSQWELHSYIEFQRKMHKLLTKQYNAYIIDSTNKTVCESFDEIKHHLAKRI